MRVELDAHGNLTVVPSTGSDAFALKSWYAKWASGSDDVKLVIEQEFKPVTVQRLPPPKIDWNEDDD